MLKAMFRPTTVASSARVGGVLVGKVGALVGALGAGVSGRTGVTAAVGTLVGLLMLRVGLAAALVGWGAMVDDAASTELSLSEQSGEETEEHREGE